MKREKAHQLAELVSGRKGPATYEQKRSVYKLASDDTIARGRLSTLMLRARGDNAALAELTTWIQQKTLNSLMEFREPGINIDQWRSTLSWALQLTQRDSEYSIDPETLFTIYSDRLGDKKAAALVTLAREAELDDDKLRELIKQLHALTGSPAPAPSMVKVQDLEAWTRHIVQAQELAKMSRDTVSDWIEDKHPELTPEERGNLIIRAQQASDSPDALRILAIELHRLYKAQAPLKVPSGYFD